jgi:hypothetical protein
MTEQNNGRHAPLDELKRYLDEEVQGAFASEGNPSARLIVRTKPVPSFGLQILTEGPKPDLSRYEYWSFHAIEQENEGWQEVRSTITGNDDEVYAILCTIADRVHNDQTPFHRAITEALDSFDETLALRNSLSLEKQVGLFGELLTLKAMIRHMEPIEALERWRGPKGEQHDFSLPQTDVEVKTTTSERREHQISSIGQLDSMPDRSLLLLSVQITHATSSEGQTLPALVTEIRELAATQIEGFNSALAKAGYRDKESDLYTSNWILRSEPSFYSVDDDFPAITQARLGAAVSSSERIRDLHYRIDLTGLSPTQPPFSVEN